MSGPFFPYPTISSWFDEHGDFEENLSGPDLEEHAFVPGDGEMTHMDVCQFPGCGYLLSEHEEGEPCCFPYMSTRGQQHAFDCDEDKPG